MEVEGEMEDLCNSSLTFFSDQQLCYADVLSPSEVRARIEVAVLNFLRILNSPEPAISHLPLIDRRPCNTRVSQGLLTGVPWIFLSHSFCTRSLMKANAAKAFIRGRGSSFFSANSTLSLSVWFCRGSYRPWHSYSVSCELRCHAVWKVMELCFQILVEGKRVTQRELFYKLLCTSSKYFNSQLQEPGKGEIDCSASSSGYAISGDLSLLDNLVMKTDARYIIIVEKHAIFQRLVDDRVFNQIPSIIITARGYPDIATRFLLHRISRNFPELLILALVDWNPAGLAILCTFKFGSIGMGLEAYRYACNVKWLGLRGDDLELIPQESFTELKPKDLQIAKSLISLEILQKNYREELVKMRQSGRRAEIEALYFNGYDYLGRYIAKKIVQADYI